jgi:hypothetical protein
MPLSVIMGRRDGRMVRTWKRRRGWAAEVEMGARVRVRVCLWEVSGGHADYRMGARAGPRAALLSSTWRKLGAREGGIRASMGRTFTSRV